jgi:GMP synthase (glutamine-hydrolysing)
MKKQIKPDLILILDFGSQYTQLIARRTREMDVYSEIQPYSVDLRKYFELKKDYSVKGIILSGGPSSVLDSNAPVLTDSNFRFILSLGIPVLGICYGLQYLVYKNGGKVHKSGISEYGFTRIKINKSVKLFSGCGKELVVWMSHGDSVDRLPVQFIKTSESSNRIISSLENGGKKIYALQFHPEVHHTEKGNVILENFLFRICKITNLFKPAEFIASKIDEIRITAGKEYVLCALSGGVDSSVAAVLVHKALGKKLICVHIDNGMMRKNESAEIIKIFKEHFKFNLIFVDAADLFLKRLKGVTDPEKKRKIIGKTFIDVFEKEAIRLKNKGINIKYLVQGTLYPDVIESVSLKGPSVTIKSHHNVGGLPAKMNLKLIEPFRELFKDEVRKVGRDLNLPEQFIKRHPFPGPGLAVRIIGSPDKSKLDLLRNVDDIFINSLHKFRLYDKIWQAFAVLLPVQSVGVMGDERSYENVIALRAVNSVDGMTADFFHFPKEFLTYVSNKIINSVRGVNRVVYDISSKPPATIEWE